jgi:hypothetical protein
MADIKTHDLGARRGMARLLIDKASIALVYLGIVATFAAVSLIGCVIWLLISWWVIKGSCRMGWSSRIATIADQYTWSYLEKPPRGGLSVLRTKFRECPLLAQSRHASEAGQCPLLGGKADIAFRTSW